MEHCKGQLEECQKQLVESQKQQYAPYNRKMLYVTSTLFLDTVIGQAITGTTFHELLGIEFPSYLEKMEFGALTMGWLYLVYRYVTPAK